MGLSKVGNRASWLCLYFCFAIKAKRLWSCLALKAQSSRSLCLYFRAVNTQRSWSCLAVKAQSLELLCSWFLAVQANRSGSCLAVKAKSLVMLYRHNIYLGSLCLYFLAVKTQFFLWSCHKGTRCGVAVFMLSCRKGTMLDRGGVKLGCHGWWCFPSCVTIGSKIPFWYEIETGFYVKSYVEVVLGLVSRYTVFQICAAQFYKYLTIIVG